MNEFNMKRPSIQKDSPKSSVWKIIHNKLVYPYHLERVQVLKSEIRLVSRYVVTVG